MMPPRPGPARLGRIAGLVLLAATAIGGRANAQQFGSELGEISGYWEVGVLSSKEERSRNDSGANTDELRFTELLHLDAVGHIYHPRFLEYHGSADVEFQQETKDGENNTLSGGGWSLRFLPEHRTNLTLFGNVRQTQIDQPFFQTYEHDSMLYGATGRFVVATLPFELSYTHRSSERTGTRSDLDQETDELLARAWYDVGSWMKNKVEYRTTSEEVRQQDISRQRFSATNTTFFDELRTKEFRGGLYFQEQKDTRDRMTSNAFGRFSWQHSDRLTSEYSIDLARSEHETQESDRWSAGASLRHVLYESLVSSVEGSVDLHDGTAGSMQTFRLRVTEDYTKRLGQWGRLDIDLIPFAEMVQHRPELTEATILGETRVLNGTIPVELGKRRVNAGTIVVTDSSGSILYVEGIDYIVTVVGDVTELTRLITGVIADGEGVLVDYEHRLTGASDILSRGLSFYAGLSIRESMVLYGKLRTSEEDLKDGDPNRELVARDNELIGLRLTRGGLRATLELERDDSNSHSYVAMLQSLTYTTPPRRRWRGTVSTTHRYQDFEDLDESVSRLGATATFSRELGRRGRLDLAADYRKETRDGARSFQDLDGFGLRATLTWNLGSARLTLAGALSRADLYGQDESVDRLSLTLRRHF